MNREWNDSQPIYRQLRDRGAHMILDGVLEEGDPLPSVRNVAAEYRVNPLTVLKAYQQLVDEELVEMKRGLGMFVKAGARDLLLKGERQKFLNEEWPRVAEKIQRLGLTQKELDTAAVTCACGAFSASAKGAASLPAWGNVPGLVQQDGISAESATHFGAESRFQRFVTQGLEFLGRYPRLV